MCIPELALAGVVPFPVVILPISLSVRTLATRFDLLVQPFSDLRFDPTNRTSTERYGPREITL